MNNIHGDFSKFEIPVVVKLTAIFEITHKLIYSFPKHERYSLGERLSNSILETIEILVLANQSSKYEKEKILLKANAKIELLKILFRLTLNCKIIEIREYLNIEARLQETGKMTQGWIKYSREMR